MNSDRTVFSQLTEHLSYKEFQKCVARYGGDRYAKKLTCWQQFLAMAFAQLTYRESLRDIKACLGAVGGKVYHMGFGSSVARSTLADPNESRDWRIFADFAQVLIGIARPLYAGNVSDDLKFAFLRTLAGNDRTLGIAWYSALGDDGCADGRHPVSGRQLCFAWASIAR